jgi:hypothetical protein
MKHAEAIEAGVTKKTLSRMVESGKIRAKGARGRRRYLMRDIARFLASRKRRQIAAMANPQASKLTKPRPRHHNNGMSTPKPPLRERVAAFVETAGSFSAASRRLDVPIDALKRAAKGEHIREGTALLIENRLNDRGE